MPFCFGYSGRILSFLLMLVRRTLRRKSNQIESKVNDTFCLTFFLPCLSINGVNLKPKMSERRLERHVAVCLIFLSLFLFASINTLSFRFSLILPFLLFLFILHSPFLFYHVSFVISSFFFF